MSDHQDRSSKHKISLIESQPIFRNEYGSIHQFTDCELPILKNLSLQRIELEAGALLEPKWFVNCNALGYILDGHVHISFLDSASAMGNFTGDPGQMFHINSGALFHIENIGKDKVVVILALRHEHPKDFQLSGSSGAFTDAVLANSFDLKASVFSKSTRSTKSNIIVARKGEAVIPINANWPHANRFDIEEQQAPTYAPGIGSAKKARSQFWKALSNIAMYSLRVEEEGMREIHWHPETVEMGYINKGWARMSIMDPDGSVETFTLKSGDVYFIPASYPHQIEVLGDEQIHFLIFFDQPMPKDVGFRQAGAIFSPEVIAAAFGVDKKVLPVLPYDNEDPLLVKKINFVDPVSRSTKL